MAEKKPKFTVPQANLYRRMKVDYANRPDDDRVGIPQKKQNRFRFLRWLRLNGRIENAE